MYVSWQPSLFGGAEIDLDPEFGAVRRIVLDDDSWIDHLPGWLDGADDVFTDLVTTLPWTQREVVMYHRELPEPRLTWWWSEAAEEPEPLPVLPRMRHALSAHYERTFDSIGCNWYRDGRDSVAWHRDRERTLAEPLVAIVSVGTPRNFLVRRHGGGRSISFALGHGGDPILLSKAKLARSPRPSRIWPGRRTHSGGPRISITFRHHTEPVATGPVAASGPGADLV